MNEPSVLEKRIALFIRTKIELGHGYESIAKHVIVMARANSDTSEPARSGEAPTDNSGIMAKAQTACKIKFCSECGKNIEHAAS